MRCEVCGRQIRGEPRKVMIERAKMLVCERCAELGSLYVEPEVKISKTSSAIGNRGTTPTSTVFLTKRAETTLPEEVEIAENFGSLIREARERLGLSHEDLGKKIGEKISVLKKVESEKMFPDEKLATKLEHVLKVKLLVQAEKEEVPLPASTRQTSTLTLGEIARLKTGKRRSPENESGDSS